MINENYFHEVLIDPACSLRGGHLRIVSGYATANMAYKHMESLKNQNLNVSIELIIGMTTLGIEEAQHSAFCKMIKQCSQEFDFKCRYIVQGNPVHAKTYVWLDYRKKPIKAFCGSANYTITGFLGNQIETMFPATATSVNEFHNHIFKKTSVCIDPNIDTQITLIQSSKEFEETSTLESCELSLLTRNTGDTPKKSGINWGQREKRNPNQAYINIPADIGKSGFFPERNKQFTVLTDDGDSFICIRAQDQGKGLHTTQDNSLLGEYLRKRMGVGSGKYVTRQHLIEYGRTDITFLKIDSETYLMDFRPKHNTGQCSVQVASSRENYKDTSCEGMGS